MRKNVSLLSPPALICFCWTLTFFVAGCALLLPDVFDLLPVFMAREDLSTDGFSVLGSVWIALCLFVYLTVDFAVKTVLSPNPTAHVPLDVDRAALLCFRTNLLLLGVTAIWIATTAQSVGGIRALAALVYLDSLGARDLLLQNKLFTGMRLFYAALPATGAMAAILLALQARCPLSQKSRRLCQITFAINLIALLVLPIVMSQRLLLLQFLLSAYIGVCMVRGRFVGLAYLPLGLFLFLATWVLREAITNPSLDRSAFDIGLQKLAFYFVNDLWNSYRPLKSEISHTFGMFSLRGLLFFSFTDGYFTTLLSDRLIAIEDVRGGGDFSIFTAPYVDFGPVIGVLCVALMAAVFRYAYWAGSQSPLGALVYGQIAASLLFSMHGTYFTHHNFFFSLIILASLCHLSRQARHGPRYGAQHHV
ncbi:hypothetical protein C1J05_21100 [Sulfitobacter sp. JL08]|uniref:O-antigen polymerase n=1 Tax=Sulfitobacter sp. JL08 TaxID=2070369 RepID=UPI000E0BFF17|nr:O-antigen polymerase [Sulfitobacter sp. JL08]AXI56673.1 hypothetical protein C1J05_21100 [Sulfitobacter sp. JL08]